MELNTQSIMKMNALMLIITLLFSCKENNSSSREDAFHMALADAGETYNMEELRAPESAQPAPAQEIIERKLIRNGNLEFKTEAVKKTKAEIETICKALNAYISSESENNYGDRLQFNQVIRVPASQFDELIKSIEPLAKKIENKSISTQDVTEEFIDAEARLKTKRELENRYREILKQAKTVEEIVSIESQIANVRAEIESMEGRLKYLSNQVAFSTLDVTYYETIGTDFGFASRFVDSLKDGWDNLLVFIIFTMKLWPFAMGIFALGFWWWKKRSRRKKAQA